MVFNLARTFSLQYELKTSADKKYFILSNTYHFFSGKNYSSLKKIFFTYKWQKTANLQFALVCCTQQKPLVSRSWLKQTFLLKTVVFTVQCLKCDGRWLILVIVVFIIKFVKTLIQHIQWQTSHLELLPWLVLYTGIVTPLLALHLLALMLMSCSCA